MRSCMGSRLPWSRGRAQAERVEDGGVDIAAGHRVTDAEELVSGAGDRLRLPGEQGPVVHGAFVGRAGHEFGVELVVGYGAVLDDHLADGAGDLVPGVLAVQRGEQPAV